MDILEQLQEIRQKGEECVLSTIVKANGSTPRSIGAKMLTFPDGKTLGTIGGGKLEFLAVQDAQKCLETAQSTLQRYDLVPEGTGMHCGGVVEIFHEVFTHPTEIIIFGAGHVGQQLAPMAANAGFPVRVIDPRGELLDVEAFSRPGLEKIQAGYVEGIEQCTLNSQTVCIVVSLGQEKEILEKLLLNHDLRYVGVMGSKRKISTIQRDIMDAGVAPEKWEKVKGPVGLDLGGEPPFEVALSIMAELIMELRGGTGAPLRYKLKEPAMAANI